MRVLLYTTTSGRRPVEEFLKGLPANQKSEVYALLEDLEAYGIEAPLVSLRQIRGKLWEIRISKVRIFYSMVDSATMILLHACKKVAQKAKKKDIDLALQRMNEVLGK